MTSIPLASFSKGSRAFFYNLLLHVSSGFQQQLVLKKPPTFLFILHCIQFPLHLVLCLALVLALVSRGHRRRSLLPYSHHPFFISPSTISLQDDTYLYAAINQLHPFPRPRRWGPYVVRMTSASGAYHVSSAIHAPPSITAPHRRRSGQLTCHEAMAACPLISSLQFLMHCVAEYAVFAYLTSTVLEFRLQS